MTEVRKALEAEREMEREFVALATRTETAPKGWPAALVMFHVSMWRERLRNALTDLDQGRPYTPPLPSSIDEVNDAELAGGIGTPLTDAAARSDRLLGEIIDLHDRLGERPLQWYFAKTTGDAALRAGYSHPRLHIFEYLRENGDRDRAVQLCEEAISDIRATSAFPMILAAWLYRLACARASDGRLDEALTLLEEALPMRPDLKEGAVGDTDLALLHDNPRFQAAVKS